MTKYAWKTCIVMKKFVFRNNKGFTMLEMLLSLSFLMIILALIPFLIQSIYALKENSDIKQVAVVQTIGVSAENYWKETNEQHIILKAYNETAMQNLKIQLINGRLPNNINEIVNFVFI